jgi:hypothetical protein
MIFKLRRLRERAGVVATLLGIVAGLLLLYAALVVLLWRSYRHDPDVDALRDRVAATAGTHLGCRP